MSSYERPSVDLRYQIKRSQGFMCPVEEKIFDAHDLVVHHIKPVALHTREQKKTREYNNPQNLVAINPEWHPVFDRLALDEGILLTDLFDRFEVGELVVFQRLPIANKYVQKK